MLSLADCKMESTRHNLGGSMEEEKAIKKEKETKKYCMQEVVLR